MPDPMSDFGQIAAMGDAEETGIPPELREALDRMRDFQSRSMVKAKQEEQVLPPSSISVNTAKGTVTLNDLPIATYEAYNRDRQELNQIRGAFHQQATRLAYEEQKAREQPAWVQLATALSANLAQAKDMPGWVQGLGRTAAQLNPRPEEIAARRMGVLREEAKIAERGASLGMESERLGLEQKREGRLTAESAIQQRAKFQAEHVNAAIRGEGDPATTTTLGVQMGIIPPEQASAFQKNLEAMKKSYFEKAEAADKLKMSREIQIALVKAGIDEAAKTRAFAQQDKLVGMRLSAMTAENDKKIAAAEKKGEAKKAELKDFEVKELEQYVAADRALDEIEALLRTTEAQDVMGPYTGTWATLGVKLAPRLADPNGTVKGMISKLKLQTAQAIKSTGAGARGFGPMERPFFENLAEGITNTAEQNQKIIETWRQYLDQNRRGVLANHSDETVQKYPKMFGPRLGEGAAKKFVFNPTTGKIEEQ